MRRIRWQYCTALMASAAANAAPAVAPVAESAAPQRTVEPPALDIKPRLELVIPSVERLLAEAARSHAGPFVESTRDILLQFMEASSEGVDRGTARTILEQIRGWPDTPLGFLAFAPDREGRARWAIRLHWPLGDLHDRLAELTEEEAVAELIEGLQIRERDEGGYAIRLGDSDLAYLVPDGERRALISSHLDTPVPAAIFGVENPADIKSLVAARLHLTPTEQDSGAIFSSFSIVTALDYAAVVREDGNWSEIFELHWPPISGMGLKTFVGSVRQTFVVPPQAFGAVVFDSVVAPNMLDAMGGFGAEVIFEGGQMTIVGESALGPIATHGESEICVTVLPGTGFLPMPDLAFQSRTFDPDEFIESVRKAAERTNRLHRDRERREPWHEESVRDRAVFWREATQQYPGVIMPLNMTPVLFTTTETDADGKERNFAVLAMTSTAPTRLVERWLDFPRRYSATDEASDEDPPAFLPLETRTDGQAWINWRQVYDWVHPYIDLSLSAVSSSALLPRTEDVAFHLTHGTLTADVKYAGLSVTHAGPIPFGPVSVPTMITTALAPNPSGSSDLARERLASQRLRVLYHHSKLFKKDLGRWPAEVRELDGYVDFAGNPHLLRLQLSARKRWSDWFNDIFDPDEKQEEEEPDEAAGAELDTDLYVIDWGREQWSLGYAPNTFEHLEKLYIDQDGQLHRMERPRDAETETGESKAGGESDSQGESNDDSDDQTEAEDSKEDDS